MVGNIIFVVERGTRGQQLMNSYDLSIKYKNFQLKQKKWLVW